MLNLLIFHALRKKSNDQPNLIYLYCCLKIKAWGLERWMLILFSTKSLLENRGGAKCPIWNQLSKLGEWVGSCPGHHKSMSGSAVRTQMAPCHTSTHIFTNTTFRTLLEGIRRNLWSRITDEWLLRSTQQYR